MSDLAEHEKEWRKPPPGTVLVTEGAVREGDWFYIEQLGAWGLVPKSGWGEAIANSGHLVARGELDKSKVYVGFAGNDEVVINKEHLPP